ncbi:MAG: hypothetical protein HQM13_20925 [SAR324 cluster bacterium]|nr:hypothetical protein [SAR324 cluster bacterium]
MIAGVLLVVFVILSSNLIFQGAQQLQKRQLLNEIFMHLDQWTEGVKKNGFASETLSTGWHQKQIADSLGNSFLLTWNVQKLLPGSKGVTFQLQDPVNKTVLHEWKTGILFQP